jgi:hypothetical protein
MKKNVMLLVVTVSSMLRAAEPVLERAECLLVPYKGTLIQVLKGTIGRHIEHPVFNPGLIILGKNEQRKLQQATSGGRTRVGEVSLVRNNSIFIKHKGCDSASDDDTFKPFTLGIKKSWNDAYSKKYVKCSIVTIVEPRIEYEYFVDDMPRQYGYFPTRVTEEKNVVLEPEFFGEKALEEAKKDLAVCYENALLTGSIMLGQMPDKTIAIDPLGTAVGIPGKDAVEVAVESVREFIEHTPHVYALIVLCVKKRSSFDLCKQLFGPWLDEQ